MKSNSWFDRVILNSIFIIESSQNVTQKLIILLLIYSKDLNVSNFVSSWDLALYILI